MAPPEINDRDVPLEGVVDENLMCSMDRGDMFDTVPSIEDKTKDQLAAQTEENFDFKKAARYGCFPERPSLPRPITLHSNPSKDIRLRHKCLLSDHQADTDVIRCTEFPYTYIIGKDRVDIQSNVTPSSGDPSPQNDQQQSKVMIFGNRRIQSGREAWEVPDATSFYCKNHIKDLFEIRSKSGKLVFGGYGEGPLSPPAKARGWITTLSKKLQMKYDNSLLNRDQRSNRNRKKVEEGASFSSFSAVSSPFLAVVGSVLGKHLSGTESVNHQIDLQKQCPSDEQKQQKKQGEPTHHSASSTDPSDSTQSPLSSSSKSEGNGNIRSSPNTQQRKRGTASNEGGRHISGESPSREGNSDDLPRSDPSQQSRSVNASAQVKGTREECVAFEQKLHLSEESPRSASTKIPPDKATKEQVSPESSYEPPGTEIPSTLLCNSEPLVKSGQNTDAAATRESEDIAKDPSRPIQGDATVNQPRSLFNVKPPPHSQASQEAEITSSQIEWNESATKSSASVEIQLREYGPISKDSEFGQEIAFPGDELLQTKVAANHEETNETITDREPIQIEKSPSCPPEAQADGMGSPAFPTTFDQNLLDDYDSLFGPIEPSTEFSPVLFSSTAGDDGFLPQKYSSQVCKQEVVTSDDGEIYDEIYEHPIEEAGQPGNASLMVSKPTLPADWMQVNQPPPQAIASESLCLWPYTAHGGRIVGPFSDLWGFTTFVGVDDSVQIL